MRRLPHSQVFKQNKYIIKSARFMSTAAANAIDLLYGNELSVCETVEPMPIIIITWIAIHG